MSLQASTARALLPLIALLASGAANAHTGHATASLFDGLTHPFGLDHLLAMLAVGLWSAHALPARQCWAGPATFMLALLLSATAGAAGLTLPYLEHMVSLSVMLFGAMLLAIRRLPVPAGLALIAAAASLHGIAHGAEAPAGGFAGYALGFVLSTALLHASGVSAGALIQRLMAARTRLLLGGIGLGFSGAGAYLLTQL